MTAAAIIRAEPPLYHALAAKDITVLPSAFKPSWDLGREEANTW